MTGYDGLCSYDSLCIFASSLAITDNDNVHFSHFSPPTPDPAARVLPLYTTGYIL